MFQKNKIGVGILTKNNESGFSELISSLPDYVTPYICYNSCSYKNQTPYKSHTYNKNVCNAWAKNRLIRMMVNDECEHLFILEDGIKIQDKNVFNLYIEAASKSGLWTLLFKENQTPKNSIQYDTVGISFSKESCRSFFYIHRGVVKNIGFYDERYVHDYHEQTDLLYRILLKGLLPGWQWFPDLENSNNLLDFSAQTKQLDQQKEYFEKIWFNFKNKTEYNTISVTSESEVIKKLETIKNTYAKQ